MPTNLPRRDPAAGPAVTDAPAGAPRAVEDPQPDVLASISMLAQLPDRGGLRADFTGVDSIGIRPSRARLSDGNLAGVTTPLAGDVQSDGDRGTHTLGVEHVSPVHHERFGSLRLLGAEVLRLYPQSMTAERVTVSLPETLLHNAREAVDAGQAPSLSAFVADALQARLTRARALSELEQVLGGRPPLAARKAVRATLGLPPAATA